MLILAKETSFFNRLSPISSLHTAVRRAKYRAGGEYALKQVNIRTRKRTVNPAALLSPSCRALPGERGVKLGARLAARDLGKKTLEAGRAPIKSYSFVRI